MYEVATQKTYKGRSANQILKGAEINEMRAGNVEITIADMPGYIGSLTDSGNLALATVDGVEAVVECGLRAKTKLESLTEQAEEKQQQVNG